MLVMNCNELEELSTVYVLEIRGTSNDQWCVAVRSRCCGSWLCPVWQCHSPCSISWHWGQFLCLRPSKCSGFCWCVVGIRCSFSRISWDIFDIDNSETFQAFMICAEPFEFIHSFIHRTYIVPLRDYLLW